MRALALFLLTVAALEPALAQSAKSVDTELVKGRCRFIEDDGEVGHYALKRCPGLNGIRVYTTAGVNQTALAFQWGKSKPKDVVQNSSIGLKLEWRGIPGSQGFKPYATIVRVGVMDHEADRKHDVLAVIRMEVRDACLLAAIDAAGNTDALALARATADVEAPAFSCRKDGAKARVVGAPSIWAQMVIGLPGDPPQ